MVRATCHLEVVRSPLFRPLQGVADIPTRQQLVVADYSHRLLRVDLRTRVVTRSADAAGSTSLGVDGIVWDNGSIDQQADVADEPAIGTVWRGGF